MPARATQPSPHPQGHHSTAPRSSGGRQANRAFSVIFLIELWERFGYYGMLGILLLFMVEQHHFAERDANLLLGAFTALTYAAPSVGGWVGDKILGTRRCMVLGAAVLAAGYMLLSAPVAGLWVFYLAMAVISTGNGLFKPNAANMVRKIYEGDDNRIDAAFTIYYMAVNVGSTVSLLLTPWLRARYGWHAAFLACFAGMMLGLGNYVLTRRYVAGVGSPADHAPLSWRALGLVLLGSVCSVAAMTAVFCYAGLARSCVIVAALIVLGIWVYMYRQVSGVEKYGLRLIYVLSAQSGLYFIFYQQMQTSLTLFALFHVKPDFYLGGAHLFSWSAAQFQALNPIWIMLLSPFLAFFYVFLGRRGWDMAIAGKFLFGFVCVAAGFGVWWLVSLLSPVPRLSPWVMVAGYFFFSLGELLISGLGLAIMARYCPPSLSGFMMGAYFTTCGVSMYAGSAVANLAATVPAPGGGSVAQPSTLEHLAGYTHLYGMLSLLALVCIAGFALCLPMVTRWNREFQRHGAAQP